VTEEQLSALAHELKTPIAIIAGYAELVGARSDEETRLAAAEQIAAAAKRLSTAVDRLVGTVREADGSLSGANLRPLQASDRERPWRVLVVDDDPFVRRLLRMTLSPERFEIAEASDGDVALSLSHSQQSELMVLDWQMPRLSGARVLEALRDEADQVPVLVLTADAHERERALSLGANAFLTKPFSPLELIATIERLLAHSTADQVA
jgi:CheY-like chemotaxis protein